MTECHWCKNDRGDGEPLGDTGLWVCRDCIRDMGRYKRELDWQFFLDADVSRLVDEPDAFREDISAAIDDVFDDHGIEARKSSGGWDVREGK